jgi:LysR family transcriptional regulator, transcription activator of glutamate synthase operon
LVISMGVKQKMNTEWFQSFVEAVRRKSLSRAAKALNLSQPALSKHIRHLEQDLDVVLFHRTSAGSELTEAGERFYNRIVPVIDELNAVRRSIICRRGSGETGFQAGP